MKQQELHILRMMRLAHHIAKMRQMESRIVKKPHSHHNQKKGPHIGL